MAWNPEAITPGALAAYPQQWAQASFDAAHAARIGELITRYSMLVARRKPELVDQDSFALGEGAPATLDGGEFGAIVAEWQALEQRMLGVKACLPADQHDAYYQLISIRSRQSPLFTSSITRPHGTSAWPHATMHVPMCSPTWSKPPSSETRH